MKRQWFVFIITVLLLMGSLVGTFGSIAERDYELRGYVNPTHSSDLPFRIPQLGVNAELTQYTEDELHQQFALMRQANITWVRQFIYWDVVEWATWDRILGVIAEYPELEMVAVLVDSNLVPPADLDTFTDFAADFAARYQEEVNYYQIWDEPNITTGWGNEKPQPIEYLAMLEAGYSAIHQADPDSYVIAAALAPTTETGPDNLSDIIYLDELYTLGAAQFADAFAAKPYGFDLPPDDRTVDNDTLNFSRIIALREVMIKHGDGKTALWASNWGWNNHPDSIWGNVTEVQQVEFTLAALARAEQEWAWLGGMILREWQPDAPSDDSQWGFSLLSPSGEPNPLYHALAELPAQTSATNGLYSVRNPFASYSGAWTFGTLGADIGWVQDSRVTFDFTGSDVAVLVREDDYVAYLYATIDDEQANALPQDTNGNAYLLLKSDDLLPQVNLVAVGSDLGKDTHTLSLIADELIPDEINNRWSLVGFAVSSDNLAEPYNRQIVIACITTLVTLVAVLLAGWQLNWMALAPVRVFWQSISMMWQLAFGVLASAALTISMFLTWQDGMPNVFKRESVQLVTALLTAGIAYLNLGIIITLLCCIVLFWIIYNRLQIGLLLVVFWSPFFMYPVELYRFAFPVAEVILLITSAAWILHFVAERPKITLKSIDWFVITWVILGIISLIWSEWRSAAITELRTLFIQPALFYFILKSTKPNEKQLWQLVGALLAAGMMVSVIGIFGWIRNDVTVITAEEGARRLASVYGSPNNVGLLLGRCIPFALAIALLFKKYRPIAIISLLTMGVAIALSQSAGALFIGVPVAVAATLLAAYGKRAVLPLGALVILGGVAVMLAAQMPRFERLLSLDEGTNFYRIRVWESAINAIEDHPVTGLGLDQFLYQFRGEYIIPDAWEEPNLSHPHNIILDFWTRLGLPGVIWFIGLLLVLAQKAWRNRRSAIMVGVIGSFAGLLAHGMIDNSIYVLDLVIVFMLMLGIVQEKSDATV